MGRTYTCAHTHTCRCHADIARYASPIEIKVSSAQQERESEKESGRERARAVEERREPTY